MSDERYMIRWRGQESGPFSVEEIRDRLDSLEIGVWHEVHHEGKWRQVEAFLRIMDGTVGGTGSVTRPSRQDVAGEAEEDGKRRKAGWGSGRSFRMLYAFLGIVGGPLGVHNFYIRRWPFGVGQLALTGLAWKFGWPLIIPFLWAYLEVIIIWQDAEGRGMI